MGPISAAQSSRQFHRDCLTAVMSSFSDIFPEASASTIWNMSAIARLSTALLLSPRSRFTIPAKPTDRVSGDSSPRVSIELFVASNATSPPERAVYVEPAWLPSAAAADIIGKDEKPYLDRAEGAPTARRNREILRQSMVVDRISFVFDTVRSV